MKKTRIVALFLVMALVLSLAPSAAFAAEDEMIIMEPEAEAVVEAQEVAPPALEQAEDPYVPVTGVFIDAEDLYMKTGEAFGVRAVVSPENATNQTVEWATGNSAVATIKTVDGVTTLTAVGEGVTTLTVKTLDPKAAKQYTDTRTVYVNGNYYGPQGRGGNTLVMVYPEMVEFVSEGSDGYYNRIKPPLSTTMPIQFSVVLANDMQGASVEFILDTIMPKINIYDLQGEVVLSYGDWDGLYLVDYDEAANVIKFAAPAYSLAPRTHYELIFDSDLCGYDASHTLGNRIIFDFGVDEASPVPRPAGLKYSAYSDRMYLTWTPLAGVDGYMVYVDGTPYTPVENAECWLFDLYPATGYNVQVAGYVIDQPDDDHIEFIEGPRSAVLHAITLLPPVEDLFATDQTQTGLYLRWDRIDEASHYVITMNGDDLMTVENTGRDVQRRYISGLKPGAKYTFKVTALLKVPGGPDIYGENTGNILAYTVPGAPGNMSIAHPTRTSVDLAWRGAQNVTHYRIYANGERVATVKAGASAGQSYTVKGLKPNTLYTFKVCAVIRYDGMSLVGPASAKLARTLK